MVPHCLDTLDLPALSALDAALPRMHLQLLELALVVSLRRVALAVLLISTTLGFFFAGQIYYSAAFFHHPVGWWQALYWAFGDWYEWALLSPIIFWLCRRFPFDRHSWHTSLPVHLLSGIGLSGLHAVLCALAAVIQAVVTE